MAITTNKIFSKDLDVYDDKKTYYIRNAHGNVLPVTKPILMYRFGYVWVSDPHSLVDETSGKRIGLWKKKLPAEEGFEVVTEKEWLEHENERLRNEGRPTLTTTNKPTLGPDMPAISRKEIKTSEGKKGEK